MLSLIFPILVLFLQDAAAHAIDTNITSLSASNVSSPNISASGNGTTDSQQCDNINNCRTMSDIVQSCIVTILACVWFAVHRNVPEPKIKKTYSKNFFVMAVQRAWDILLNQRQSVIVFFVTLIVPEWVLAWALRQRLVARDMLKKLKTADAEALRVESGRYLQMGTLEGERENQLSDNADDSTSQVELTREGEDGERSRLIQSPPKTCQCDRICEKCKGRGSPCDITAAAKLVAKREQGMSQMTVWHFSTDVARRLGIIARLLRYHGRIPLLQRQRTRLPLRSL